MTIKAMSTNNKNTMTVVRGAEAITTVRGTVFVLQDDGTKNLYPAVKYGKIEIFTNRDMSLFNNTWLDDLYNWLSAYDPQVDHLLLIGDPVLIGAACAIISKWYDVIKILKWDRQEKQYIPFTINLERSK